MNEGRSSRSDFKFKLFIWCYQYLPARRKFCKVRATGEDFLKYRCVPFSILSFVNEIITNGQFQNAVKPARVRDYGKDGRGWSVGVVSYPRKPRSYLYRTAKNAPLPMELLLSNTSTPSCSEPLLPYPPASRAPCTRLESHKGPQRQNQAIRGILGR